MQEVGVVAMPGWPPAPDLASGSSRRETRGRKDETGKIRRRGRK